MPETKFKIFKYVVEPTQTPGGYEVEMARSAKVLDVQTQLDVAAGAFRLVLWALVMPASPKVRRRVALVATGDELSADLVEHFDHVTTLQSVEPRETTDGQIVPKSIVHHVFLERDIEFFGNLTQN
jgi:hypothetical protein